MNPVVLGTISSENTISDLREHISPRKSFRTQLNQKLSLLTSVLVCSCSLQPQTASKVLVVDHFKVPQFSDNGENVAPDTSHLIDLDRDSSPDFSHGLLISKVINTRGVRVVSLDGGVSSIKNISCNTKIVNISLSIDLSFKELSEKIGLKVTPDNVRALRAEVVNRLEALPNNQPDIPQSVFNTVKNIRHLETLVSQGVTPVIAAGNMGRETLNLLTLASGSVVVGGLDEQGNKHPDSGNNSLVTEWRPFAIQPQIINGGMTLYGKQIDLKWSKTSSKGKYLELQVVPKELLRQALDTCEQATLQKLAEVYQKLGLESGIYLPTHIFFDSEIDKDTNTGYIIPANRLTNDRCLIAFQNTTTPHVQILKGEGKEKIPTREIRLINPEILVQANNQVAKAVLSERELAPILIQAGLQSGNYDLLAIKHSLENNADGHFIRLNFNHNALVITDSRYRFANIRGAKPQLIEGTSFATPLVAAELAQKTSINP